MNAALINPFTNSGAHVPEAPESAAAIACPQPRAAAAPVSDGALYGSLPTGEIEPSVACASSEAATDPGRAVAATKFPNSGAPLPRGEPVQTDATQPAGSPNISTTLSHNKITQAVEIQNSCIGVGGHANDTTGSHGFQVRIDPGVQDHIHDLERLIGVAGKRRRKPLALPRFVPDKEAMWDAMYNPNAPRALETDPVWADASPLFLRDAS